MEQANSLTLLSEHADKIGMPLCVEQINLFRTYLTQLQAWNRFINLTTIIGTEDIVVKHFIDSLAILQVETMTLGASVLDVGSGAGFPGIPLKIARPDLSVTLLEPSPKKSSFLHFIIGCLKMDHTKVCNETLERFVAQTSAAYDYVTTRALRSDFVLGHCAGLLRTGGKVLLYTAQPVHQGEVNRTWVVEKSHSFRLPQGKGRRSISVLSLVS